MIAYRISITFDFGKTVDHFEFIGPSIASAIRWVAGIQKKCPTAMVINTRDRGW